MGASTEYPDLSRMRLRHRLSTLCGLKLHLHVYTVYHMKYLWKYVYIRLKFKKNICCRKDKMDKIMEPKKGANLENIASRIYHYLSREGKGGAGGRWRIWMNAAHFREGGRDHMIFRGNGGGTGVANRL